MAGSDSSCKFDCRLWCPPNGCVSLVRTYGTGTSPPSHADMGGSSLHDAAAAVPTGCDDTIHPCGAVADCGVADVYDAKVADVVQKRVAGANKRNGKRRQQLRRVS